MAVHRRSEAQWRSGKNNDLDSRSRSASFSAQNHREHCERQSRNRRNLVSGIQTDLISSDLTGIKRISRSPEHESSDFQVEKHSSINDNNPGELNMDLSLDLVLPTDSQHVFAESQTTEQSPSLINAAPQLTPTLPHIPPQLGRGHRIKKPKKRDDWLPEGPAPMPPPEFVEPVNDPELVIPTTLNAPRRFIQITPNFRVIFVKKYWTTTNSFGISRLYYGKPSCIPDHLNSAADLATGILDPKHSQIMQSKIQDVIWPYPNISSWRLGRWLWSSEDTKSLASFKDLLNNVLLAKDFRLEDLPGTGWDKIHSLLGQSLPSAPDGEGWCQASVEIQVPTSVKKKASEKSTGLLRASKTFTVTGLWYRPICTVIKSVFSDDTAASMFHFNPFKQFWNTSSNGAERVRDELFNSDEWLRIQEEIEAIPREATDTLPRCIAALMFSSDATHLAQFGQAKLWPVYLFFGNQSKWTRCKPSAHTSHHIVYLPTLPDSVIEFIRSHVGSGTVDVLKTHCRRELFHAALGFLFDKEFLEAWKKGIVIDCVDGVRRQVFPRIFTWSADYPEKVLLASIRDLGLYPCPRCLVKKEDIPRIGMKSDRNTRINKCRIDSEDRRNKVEKARNYIYHDGFVVNSDTVNRTLISESLTPTENAFSKALYSNVFNIFNMLVVDLMHEIELGVWKALFTHLIRMLYSIGEIWVDELNARFRLIPTFGISTIRPFAADVSQMKKLAAHNFEDILQYCMPALEGLFGEWDNKIQELLFTLSYWHGLAKLRMHTDTTVQILDDLTSKLGISLRFFETVICPNFETFDTPAEKAAQVRACMRNSQKTGVDTSSFPSPHTGPKRRVFNMKTFKIHQISHYVSDILKFGTTDSYSTQIGELEHRVVKSRYRHRTNKKDFTSQLTKLSQRVENFERSAQKLQAYNIKIHEHHIGHGGTSNEMKEPVSPEVAYHIARDNRHPLYFRDWLHKYPTDPAFRDFLPKLQKHLLSRIHGVGGIGDEQQVDGINDFTVLFLYERIFSHAILRINFTTYDLRRDQDFINPRTPKRFVMVASNDDSEEECRNHPFWYAQVLGVFHADVFPSFDRHIPKPTRMEFLWVRWFGQDPTWKSGFKFHRLEHIGFIPHDDEDAFGFLDPAAVIRATHLIPAFAHSRTIELCPPSIAQDDEGDWQYFYVNRFVDRDMLIRYLGLGIGHKSSFEKSRESNESDFYTDDGDVVIDVESEQDEEDELNMENSFEEFGVDSDVTDDEEDEKELDSAEEVEIEDFEY